MTHLTIVFSIYLFLLCQRFVVAVLTKLEKEIDAINIPNTEGISKPGMLDLYNSLQHFYYILIHIVSLNWILFTENISLFYWVDHEFGTVQVRVIYKSILFTLLESFQLCITSFVRQCKIVGLNSKQHVSSHISKIHHKFCRSKICEPFLLSFTRYLGNLA